jgi:hypothetical protein
LLADEFPMLQPDPQHREGKWRSRHCNVTVGRRGALPPRFNQCSPVPEVPGAPIVGHDVEVALTKAERQNADDLIQCLLDMVDDGDLAVDGPAGVALVRRLEGAMLALRAMDGTVTPTSNVESGIPESPA